MLVTFTLSSLLATGVHVGEDVAPVISDADVDKMVADMTELTPDEMTEATTGIERHKVTASRHGLQEDDSTPRNKILPKPTNASADPLDIAVVMTQPCSESAEVPSIGPAGQLQAPAIACRGSFADQVKKDLDPNNTIAPSPFERIKPVEDMTDNDKTAVMALHGQMMGDMEDVANKTMKATMAKQIAEKVQCIADAKAKQLENLKIQLAPSVVLQAKQNVEVQAERAALQERDVQKATLVKVAASVDRMECLRKAAVKAEKVIEAQAVAEQCKVTVMQQKAATARMAVDNCARRTASDNAASRKEAAVLNVEVAKTQAVVLQAQLQAQTAEREVEELKEDSDEPVACAPDAAGAVFDAVAALTGDPELAKSITQGGGNKSCKKSLPNIGASTMSGSPSPDVVASEKESFMKDNWGDGAVPSEPQGGGAAPPTPQGITLNGAAAKSSLSDLGGASLATSSSVEQGSQGAGAKKVHRELLANAEQQWVQKGTGCPDRNVQKCLNKNQMYSSLEDAWEACGQVDDCGKILKYEETKFYLRRSTDPVVGSGQSLAYDTTSSASAGANIAEASSSATLPASQSLLMEDGDGGDDREGPV